MLRFFLLAAGGGIGTLLRYFLSATVDRAAGGVFPAGTMAVNLGGSLLIGCLWGVFERGSLTPNARLFLMTGVLGGFTTFSTFALEGFSLLRDGEFRLAVVNILVSNVVGLLLVFAGFKGVSLMLEAK